MEQTMAKNRIRLVLAVLSVVIVAMVSLGFSATSAEAAIPYCDGEDCRKGFPYEW
jgi:hypothetical protein